MPGWPSKLFPTASNSHTPFSSRRAPSPDFDEDLEPPPRHAYVPERVDPYGNYASYGSSPPRGPSSSPRSRPHMHTGSDKMFVGGGGKKKRPGVEFESRSYPSATDKFVYDGTPTIGKPGRSDERDMEAGNCATCDSRVKWPRGVNEFRCSTCLMVNDLKPAQPRSRSPRDPAAQPPGQTSGHAGPNSSNRVLPLTVERTMGIMNRCIDTYLEAYRQGHVPSSRAGVTRTPPDSPPRISFSPDKLSPTSPRPRALTGDRMKELPTTPPDDALFPQAFPFETTTSPGRPPLPFGERRPSYTLDPHSSQGPEGSQIARKPVGTSTANLPSRPTRKPPPAPVALATQSVSQEHAPHTTEGRGRPPKDVSQSIQSDGRTPPLLPPARIFKPLEDYITRSYGDHESLNTSFLTSRSRPRVPSRADDTNRPRPGQSPPKLASGTDTAISEIDAKTLLLGDVAANGLWWTGVDDHPPGPGQRRKSDRAHESNRPLVSPKNPHIHWFELDNWYHTIWKAGMNWQSRVKDEDKHKFKSESVDSDIAEGRAHLHQTLLKCTETLLKRPGRPLREPQDARFLFILLANPLIYPPSSSSSVNLSTDMIPSAWEAGNAYGIIKRILGIMSNLPNDCHRYLSSWFSRYDEPRFRSIVDLVERFVTHRLRRSHGRKKSNLVNPTAGLIPSLSGTSADTSAQLHAALGLSKQGKSTPDTSERHTPYSEDWQVKAAARIMSLLFSANKHFNGERSASTLAEDARMSRPGSISRTHIKIRGQLLSTSDFYNTMVDMSDLIADFDIWESSKGSRFAFCQYPFFLSVGAKIRIMEHDAKRQMEVRAREAFFDSLLKNKALEQNLILKVRRDCLVEDSLNGISEVVGTGQEDIKKSLKVQFVNEEGIDAGGLRKEWFLLLAREIFDPNYGLFLYDEESKFCWFNPNSFETSDSYYLVGALIGLAIYHTTIIDVPLPPFTFKKLLSSSPPSTKVKAPVQRPLLHYTLDDLAELRPSLARGLRQLLEYDGDVQDTFCRDFVAETSVYGTNTEVPLCEGGHRRPVTNSNRAEFVDLYIRYLLDTQVARQFEPFKRGFFTVCGGNALSLFQPEEIELLVRGSDEGLDVSALRGVAAYQNWKIGEKAVKDPNQDIALIRWFWELLEEADPRDQRKMLSFITASDRIPAVGATSLVITLTYAGPDSTRYPIARTCFNMLMLYRYRTKQELQRKLWNAMNMSEGFGLR